MIISLPTLNNQPIRFLILTLSLFLAGCGEKIPTNEDKSCLPRSEEADTFSKALHEYKIPHIFNMSEKCIYTVAKYRLQLKETRILIFGNPPPPGLSISWGDRNEELILTLEKNVIHTKKYLYHGIEYIAWPLSDFERAEEVLKLRPEIKEFNRNVREENAAQNKSYTDNH